MSASFRLDGQVAVVTGASSGLGAHFATVLADAGATVIAAARRKDRLDELAESRTTIVPVGCDITDEAQRVELVETARRHGPLQVLVNNAGSGTSHPALETTAADFEASLAVNLTATFALSAAAARHMREGAAIVNVASIFGLVASAPVMHSAYGAAKGAVVSLTRHLACEWAARGIRVNAIAPGWFPSELTEEMFAQPESMRWIERNTPMRRPGQLSELDGLLLLLAGPAGSFITGQTIAADGGWTAR